MAKWRQCDDTWSVVYQSVVIHVSKKQLKNIEKFQILSDNGPILTLASSARWALAFSRSKSTFSDGEGPGAAPENTYTKYPPKMGYFKNFPYEFPKILHAAPYR